MACAFGSLKTEAGLKELNDHLTGKSFLGGGATATQEDFEWLPKAPSAIDGEKFPHARRWCEHLRGLKVSFPLRRWAAASSSTASAATGDKSKDQAKLEGLLPGAIEGQVVTRFPPEPSGYLHIGHAKAAMLNNYYARHYKGKLILRFDDTNPSKEKMEFEESMIKDLETLQIKPDMVTHTSDHFEHLQKVMEGLLQKGKCYVDDTDVDTMRAERDAGTESKKRNLSVEENLRLYGEMLKGSEEGLKCCVRAKMDMSCTNKCLRDPVFYRCKTDTPHHKHGFKYKAYPTYDFACPVVDALEGVTHALRTIEYKDRAPMYDWVLEHTGSRHVEMVEFAKTQFSYTILSKRKLAWFVENGIVDGWNDPRFPTVQGIMRRGMTVEGLQDFVLTQGMSKATNMMEWDKIWAINKQKIDLIVPRYVAVAADAALLRLENGPKEPVGKLDKKHPKNDELGERLIIQSNLIYVEQQDAQAIEAGEQVTLLHWGNCFVDKITRDPKTGQVIDMVGRLNIEGNVKDTKKKIHWVSKLDDQVVPVTLRELDHLVTKPKIEDDDDMKSIINPDSLLDTAAIGDPLLKTLVRGDKMQLERRGFFIVDEPYFPTKKMVLIKIPDGKGKDMAMTSKVDPTKLQGSANKKEAPAEAGSDKRAAAAAGADKGAQAPAAAAEKGGKAKEAKAAPAKAAERPLEDISRLNIKVGRITKVWPHPDAEKLYCEEIDVGEAAPRTIASGLRAHLKQEEMEGQLVIVLANLKPRKMQGFESQGMVMCCTSKEGKVELMQPPAGAKVGERVMVEGVEMLEPDDKLNEKTGKNPWVALAPGCLTNSSRQGTYNGAVWMTSAGPVTCKSAVGGTVG